MTNRRRPTFTRPLTILAMVAAGCAGGADDPEASVASTSSTVAVTAASDDFTEVPTSDQPATPTSASESTVAPPGDPTDVEPSATDADPDAASSTAPAQSDGAPSTETNSDGSVVDAPNQTSPTTVATTSTTSTTSTSTTEPASASNESEQDRALAAAFTAQLDADDVEELGEVFDTVCLGTEFVVAFGGAAAADAAYSLNLTTVTVDSNLFNDEPLSESTAEAVVAAFGRCGDIDDLVLLELAIGPDEAELGRCVVAAIPDGLLEAALVEDYQQIDGPALDAFDAAADDAFDTCFN